MCLCKISFICFFFSWGGTTNEDLRTLYSILFLCCSFQDLDLHCEELIKEEFGAECNFDVHDAVKKLEKLGIVHRVNLLNNFILIQNLQ